MMMVPEFANAARTFRMMQRCLVSQIRQTGVNHHAQTMGGLEMFRKLETTSID
jgi:hypothetical protein